MPPDGIKRPKFKVKPLSEDPQPQHTIAADARESEDQQPQQTIEEYAREIDPVTLSLEDIAKIEEYFKENPNITKLEQNQIIDIRDLGRIKLSKAIIMVQEEYVLTNSVPQSDHANLEITSKLNPKLYVLMNQLGTGGTGNVYEIQPLNPSSKKSNDFSMVKIADAGAIEEEISSLREHKIYNNPNQNLIGFTGQSDNDPSKSYMFSYRFKGITLGDFLKKITEPNEKLQLEVMLAVLTKLKEHLHDKGLVHFDFQANNILIEIDENNKIKVSIIDYRFTVKKGELSRGNVASGWAHPSQGREQGLESLLNPNNSGTASPIQRNNKTLTFVEKIRQTIGMTNPKTDLYNLAKSMQQIILENHKESFISQQLKSLLDDISSENTSKDLDKIKSVDEYIKQIEQLLQQLNEQQVHPRLEIFQESTVNSLLERFNSQFIVGNSTADIESTTTNQQQEESKTQIDAAKKLIAHIRRRRRIKTPDSKENLDQTQHTEPPIIRLPKI